MQPAAASKPADRFPPLQSSASVPGNAGFRQAQRNTPWAGGTSSSATAGASAPPVMSRGPVSVPGPGARSSEAGSPALSRAAFPELPSATVTKVPKAAVGGNQSLRNILGDSGPVTPVWKAGQQKQKNGHSGNSGQSVPAGDGQAQAQGADQEGSGDTPGASGGKKKGKGKQKQTLFTLGSFPT